MINKSKKRKWKTYDAPKGKKSTCSDLYFIYRVSKAERGAYLNVWFDGEKAFSKTGQIYRDEVITLKQCDKETSNHLYDREYNPVSLNILCPSGAKFIQDKNIPKGYNDKNDLYNMKFQIHSIDDSSYGIWWNNLPLAHLEEIRTRIMDLISNIPVINGESLLDYCIEQGADAESKDYN